MKVAVIGAGAIGGFVGTQLAHAGEDVTFIARGATLEALKTRGIRVIMSDGSEKAVPRIKATADYSAAGLQDVVVLAMKAHQLEAVAADVPKLLGPSTVVVPMQNGIPFWYFHKHGGALEGSIVTTVDTSGAIH
jgi:2-dehydropantoate 2-reductase